MFATSALANPDLQIRGGGGHPVPEIRGGGVTGLKKNFFPPFGPQFGLNIRVGGPALNPPLLECPKSFHLLV